MKKKTYILLLCSFILVCCEISEDLPDDTVPVSFRRTILLYLGVDNNFRAEAAQKIEILRENWDKNTDGNLPIPTKIPHRPKRLPTC